MNIIKRIEIENIKGKESLKLQFENLTANQPNIIVAPNGYGKSTITKAFEAAKSGKIKLDRRDIYGQDLSNHPKLEIELYGDCAGTYNASDTENNISQNIYISVINNPLYAKNTTKVFERQRASSADLRIRDIIVEDKIPKKQVIDYSYSQVKGVFKGKGKLFLNISEMLVDYRNLKKLYDVRAALKNCISQTRIQSSFMEFLSECSCYGTAKDIKKSISVDKLESLKSNKNVELLFQCIDEMNNKPSEWQEVDCVFTAIQLCTVIKQHYDKGESNILKAAMLFHEYKELRKCVDRRIEDFNTTGRILKTRERKGSLVVEFDRAESLSNGERDVLSFIINLTKFEYYLEKKIGILIIDEVFDYLDGSNMLAVQYYLTELIERCKGEGKIIFPILFTHLDPDVFSNYYFGRKKVHYISLSATIDLKSDIVRMLQLREDATLLDVEKEEIEKYYLHYINENYMFSPNMTRKISEEFSDSNISFREKLYYEITENYLKEKVYNPVMVIAGLRIKIEEIVFKQLKSEDQNEYIAQHKVINKLDYAIEKNVDVPELFYLLQPLYNDGLHLRGKDKDVHAKIKSTYLKTNNLHVKRMIQQIFSE